MNFIQHFIFYKKDEDPGIERFRIAHELGHCALHWPLGNRLSRRIWGDIPDIGKCYMVAFNEEEEKQADAFACLLEVHRPKPLRSQTIEVNDKVHRIIKEYTEKGILQSIKG